MTALFKLPRRPLDELEQQLVAYAQRINAAEYAFLELVREFDIAIGCATPIARPRHAT